MQVILRTEKRSVMTSSIDFIPVPFLAFLLAFCQAHTRVQIPWVVYLETECADVEEKDMSQRRARSGRTSLEPLLQKTQEKLEFTAPDKERISASFRFTKSFGFLAQVCF